MASLIAEDISKTFTNSAGQSVDVLDHVSFTMSRGESLAILGPSGSGKSTLLSILGALEPPTSGKVVLADTDPFLLAESELARFRGRHIGFVFQDHHLLPQCTVLENVLVPFLADGSAGEDQVALASQLLDRVGLRKRILHRPAQLSGGERQRAAIARALVRQPTLVLADEPTGNLDQKTADTIAELLIELQQEQQTILLTVTHSESFAKKMQRQVRLENKHLTPLD